MFNYKFCTNRKNDATVVNNCCTSPEILMEDTIFERVLLDSSLHYVKSNKESSVPCILFSLYKDQNITLLFAFILTKRASFKNGEFEVK